MAGEFDPRHDAAEDDADSRPPDPPVVDVRDWPPRQHSDDVREELDREVGTLGVTGETDEIDPR